jgi:hypothetical protein
MLHGPWYSYNSEGAKHDKVKKNRAKSRLKIAAVLSY